MKKILFFTSESLVDPKRGTPIRIYNFIKQIAKQHKLWVSAPAVGPELAVKLVTYPVGNSWYQARQLARVVRSEKIDIVMTATEINILVPIIVKWLTGVKIVMDYHGLYAEELYYNHLINWPKKILLNLRPRLLLRCYDLVYVCSHKIKK